MKNSLFETSKQFMRDRTMVTCLAVLLLVGIAYIVYVSVSLQPSDLQVATRYTAFGDTHFYRNKWYYLLSFVVFGLIVMGTHMALAVKLYNRGQRPFALSLLVFTLLIFVIAWIMTRSVLGIAFL